jgi:hypothetical protein
MLIRSAVTIARRLPIPVTAVFCISIYEKGAEPRCRPRLR